MALTPNDIVHKEFDTKFRGYDVDQVNDYLDIIVASFEDLIQENNQLKNDLGVAQEKNDYFAQLQDSLNNSILVAQEAADRLKQNARKEAELILYEAEREANAHINEANEHATNILKEVQSLRENGQAYMERMEQMIREQLAMVTDPAYQTLFASEKYLKDISTDEHAINTQEISEQVDRLINQHTSSITPIHPADAIDREPIVEEPEITTTYEETIEVMPESSSDYLNAASEMTFDDLPEADEPYYNDTESVLGETIRIELPKD